MKQQTKTARTKKAAPAKRATGNAAGKNGTASKTPAGRGKEGGKENEQEAGSLLENFFRDQLQDIYYAENHILKALPKMAEAATTGELKDAFNEHTQQTEKHVQRLEQVFDMFGMKA